MYKSIIQLTHSHLNSGSKDQGPWSTQSVIAWSLCWKPSIGCLISHTKNRRSTCILNHLHTKTSPTVICEQSCIPLLSSYCTVENKAFISRQDSVELSCSQGTPQVKKEHRDLARFSDEAPSYSSFGGYLPAGEWRTSCGRWELTKIRHLRPPFCVLLGIRIAFLHWKSVEVFGRM